MSTIDDVLKDVKDVFSSFQGHAQKHGQAVVDKINTGVDVATSQLRDALSQHPLIPPSWRPSPAAPPPPQPFLNPAISTTILGRTYAWVKRNRVVIAVALVTTGTVAYKVYCHHQSRHKVRRARRARNGGREEVVIIAGSPSLPLTKSLALDMERRGFMVFVVCGGLEEENAVQAMARPDIRPFGIDITDPTLAGASVERFAIFLQTPFVPGPRMRPNNLTLKSVILIPSLNYPASPIATIPPSSFADLFNTHLLHPILTIQAFLPLLTARLTPVGERFTPAKVLVFTPSIISSINPPFHAPEATVCSALSAFTEVLAGELRPLDIPVTHMQIGTFDFSGFAPTSRAKSPRLGGDGEAAETLAWSDSARHTYGRNFTAQCTSGILSGRIKGLKGSSLKHLHHAVFDVIDGSLAGDSIRVGLGANMYGFVGRWVPRGMVSWMMEIRKVDQLSTWQTSTEASQAGSEDGEGSKDFVAIAHEGLDSGGIWRHT